MPSNERKLRLVLLINAVFSMFSGLTLLVAYGAIATMMGIVNGKVLMGVGIGLIVFGITVLIAAKRKSISGKQVRSIIVQDWAWVTGSVAVIAVQAWELSNMGYWLIGIIAMVVADFAIFQMRYLRKLST